MNTDPSMQLTNMFHEAIADIVEEAALNALDEQGRCWDGYEPVPDKTPFSKGSCRKISKPLSDSVSTDDQSLPMVRKTLWGHTPKEKA